MSSAAGCGLDVRELEFEFDNGGDSAPDSGEGGCERLANIGVLLMDSMEMLGRASGSGRCERRGIVIMVETRTCGC